MSKRSTTWASFTWHSDGRTRESSGSSARAKSPADLAIAFQLGLAYFGLGQYDQAEPRLEEVFGARPTVDGLGYYVGFRAPTSSRRPRTGAVTRWRNGASGSHGARFHPRRRVAPDYNAGVREQRRELLEVNLREPEVMTHQWDAERLEAVREQLRLSIGR